MIHKSIKSAGDPSDRDLMLYADGELEGEQRAAVEAYLARSAAGKAKVAALNLVSSVVREQALGASGKADWIADAVMVKIATEGAASNETPRSKPAAITSAPRALAAQPARDKPANDNSRRIFALAAVAVAAAAGLMLWSRMDPTTSQVGHGPVATSTMAHQQDPSSTDEGGPGVEVEAIDFGARMGTIFYVPTEEVASNVTTTVVWLNDDDDDDDSSGDE
jgi:hypothetical protein